MRGPSDSISVPPVGGAFHLDRRLLNRSLVLRGGLLPPHIFLLGLLQISPLGVAASHGLEEKREEWLRRCRRALALHHSIWFLLRKWPFNPSQPPPSSRSTPRHNSIRADPWQWSDTCILINCLSLEALTTAQLTGMWCYKQGNFTFLGWELLCFHSSCCHGGSGTQFSIFLWKAQLNSCWLLFRVLQ